MRSFTTIKTKPYIGAPFSQPVNICRGVGDAVAIPMIINWGNYITGADLSTSEMGVLWNIQQPGERVQLAGGMRSVYIDNLGCDVKIFVYFPTTDFTVACPPNSAIWFPVVAQDTLAVVYGIGFNTSNRTQSSKVLFTNVMIPPYTDIEINTVFPQWIGSNLIQRDNIILPGFGAPALGDQTVYQLKSLQNGLKTVIFPLLGAGAYFVTAINWGYYDVRQTVSPTQIWAVEFTSQSGQLIFKKSALAKVAPDFDAPTIRTDFLNISGLQLRLRANQEYYLTCSAPLDNGFLDSVFVYTYNTAA